MVSDPCCRRSKCKREGADLSPPRVFPSGSRRSVWTLGLLSGAGRGSAPGGAGSSQSSSEPRDRICPLGPESCSPRDILDPEDGQRGNQKGRVSSWLISACQSGFRLVGAKLFRVVGTLFHVVAMVV